MLFTKRTSSVNVPSAHRTRWRSEEPNDFLAEHGVLVRDLAPFFGAIWLEMLSILDPSGRDLGVWGQRCRECGEGCETIGGLTRSEHLETMWGISLVGRLSS